MANPVEEFLLEKKAFNFGGLMSKAAPIAGRVGEAAGTGVVTGVGAAAFAGLVGAAGKLYDAATVARDYRSMMEANPDLAQHQEADPSGFNRMFSSLRALAPEYTKEPLVAGHLMRNAMELEPEQRGDKVISLMNSKPQQRTGPASEAALGGFMKGIGMGPEGKKPQLQRQVKSTFRHSGEGDPQLERVEETQNYHG